MSAEQHTLPSGLGFAPIGRLPSSTMITPVWIIGFTGHRPKDTPGRTSAEMAHLAPIIRQELLALKTKAEAQQGRAEFLCGVAAGADIIAAREAEALGMPVHVILPMPQAYFEEDFQGDAFQDDLAQARRFIALAEKGTGGATFRIAHGSQLRDDCYYDVGSQIVYASDAVIALWDGVEAPAVLIQDDSGKSISPGRGGTADVIALAKADRMPYLKGKKTTEGYRWLETPVRCIQSVTGEVTGDVSNFASPTDAGLAEMKAIQHAADAEHGIQKPLTSAKELMEFVDRGAQDWATKLRGALLGGSILHFAASIIAAICIFTPDDMVQVKKDTSQHEQARPKVIFETGWFVGRLGPSRVLLLVKQGTQLHSDFDGVSKIPFAVSIEEQMAQINRELVAAGLLT